MQHVLLQSKQKQTAVILILDIFPAKVVEEGKDGRRFWNFDDF